MRGREGSFGGLTPSEAAQRRWSEAREQESDTLTPHDKTRSALERKAASGDVQAARELREHEAYWYPNAAAHGDWMAALSKVQRDVVRAVIGEALAGSAELPEGLEYSAPAQRTQPSAYERMRQG
jgi:hypothetical protein